MKNKLKMMKRADGSYSRRGLLNSKTIMMPCILHRITKKARTLQ